MKPFGQSYSVNGCTCHKCRRRGYRKGNAYGDVMRADKHRARQLAKKEIQRLIRETAE
ncbi:MULTISPECIES: hypothetical protein [Providencia]|uniref:Uncharacterized protein n=1 Tax=Providencia rettgeri TaxID=587 RepID=A0AAW6UPJ7_PRORE|nr:MULTISPECIES: hypothetical protein [Providencia]ELR5224170.1 hypothetical protein [Providencia rettgeri]MCK9789605.1 hypothetical protein [Providencia rettgeri]MDI9095120.1 hypothetical protein [Providencia rettgeri]MDX7324443.1 hypothetical protein [Providencia rettgeri]MDX7426035.1 hypothetical protein [Providencia sp. CIM-Carb-044]